MLLYRRRHGAMGEGRDEDAFGGWVERMVVEGWYS